VKSAKIRIWIQQSKRLQCQFENAFRTRVYAQNLLLLDLFFAAPEECLSEVRFQRFFSDTIASGPEPQQA
jgi:hypothetical protein